MKIIEDKSWPSHNILAIGVPVVTATLGAIIASAFKSYILAFSSVICGLVVLLGITIAYLINSKLCLANVIKEFNNLNKEYDELKEKSTKDQEGLVTVKEEKRELELKNLENRAELKRLNDKIENLIDPLALTKEESMAFLKQRHELKSNNVSSNKRSKKRFSQILM